MALRRPPACESGPLGRTFRTPTERRPFSESTRLRWRFWVILKHAMGLTNRPRVPFSSSSSGTAKSARSFLAGATRFAATGGDTRYRPFRHADFRRSRFQIGGDPQHRPRPAARVRRLDALQQTPRRSHPSGSSASSSPGLTSLIASAAAPASTRSRVTRRTVYTSMRSCTSRASPRNTDAVASYRSVGAVEIYVAYARAFGSFHAPGGGISSGDSSPWRST